MQLFSTQLEKESEISGNVLLFTMSLDLAFLISDMTAEENIVVETPVQVVLVILATLNVVLMRIFCEEL